jgi:hypothetical protein
VQGDWPPDLAHFISLDHEGQTLASTVINRLRPQVASCRRASWKMQDHAMNEHKKPATERVTGTKTKPRLISAKVPPS